MNNPFQPRPQGRAMSRLQKYKTKGIGRSLGLQAAPSLTPMPDHLTDALVPLPVLDLMIARGWGDRPRTQIPHDWRMRRGPDKTEL